MKSIILLSFLLSIFFVKHSVAQVDIAYPNTNFPDPEFVSAPYNMVTWQERDGSNLWVAEINPNTGMFSNYQIIDTNIVPMSLVMNGPEWTYNSNEIQIIYNAWHDTFPVSKIARAWQDSLGNWQTEKLQNINYQYKARAGSPGSMDSHGTYPLKAVYVAILNNGSYVPMWRELDNPSSETILPNDLIFSSIDVGIARWVENRELLISVKPDLNNISQTYLYDIRDPNNSEQLTFSASTKGDSYMWKSVNPTYNGRYMFFTTVEHDGVAWCGLNVYLRNQNGNWNLLNQIYPPYPSNYPYLISPEVFKINGNSYITFVRSSHPGPDDNSNSTIWVAPVNPNLGASFRVSHNHPMNRKEPEPYVGNNSAWIYYLEGVQNASILHKCSTGL
ncbi:MAG: hypothetical protein HN704_08725 [Bacteroidetes bacterium]|jgi:hypothetical protein|nr:hypothetical protein [Bacteroidota bacterium]